MPPKIEVNTPSDDTILSPACTFSIGTTSITSLERAALGRGHIMETHMLIGMRKTNSTSRRGFGDSISLVGKVSNSVRPYFYVFSSDFHLNMQLMADTSLSIKGTTSTPIRRAGMLFRTSLTDEQRG